MCQRLALYCVADYAGLGCTASKGKPAVPSQDLEISGCQISRRLNLRLLDPRWHVAKMIV